MKPKIMCFSGLDPSGGAGIQADIETLSSIGCHALPIPTMITAQDTRNVHEIKVAEPDFFELQARTVLRDMRVDCFKIGVLGSVATIEIVHAILKNHSHTRVVLDPVISAGGGFRFSTGEVIEAINNLIIPYTTVLTPNLEEIRALSPEYKSEKECIASAFIKGCENILLTGSHAITSEVINKWFKAPDDVDVYNWPRFNNEYHGSGCTLAAALAGYLAKGLSLRDAMQRSQEYAWHSLKKGKKLGTGQFIPDRTPSTAVNQK